MERLGIERVDRIRLAGAFGNHIDVMYATVLGMIPDCDLARVTSAGNAAGTGARIALLDSRSRPLLELHVAAIAAQGTQGADAFAVRRAALGSQVLDLGLEFLEHLFRCRFCRAASSGL